MITGWWAHPDIDFFPAQFSLKLFWKNTEITRSHIYVLQLMTI